MKRILGLFCILAWCQMSLVMPLYASNQQLVDGTQPLEQAGFYQLVPCSQITMLEPLPPAAHCQALALDAANGFRVTFVQPLTDISSISIDQLATPQPFTLSVSQSFTAQHALTLAGHFTPPTALDVERDDDALYNPISLDVQVSPRLDSSFDTSALGLGFNSDYQFSDGALAFRPSGRLMYSQAKISNNNLNASDESLSALTLSLGGQISYSLTHRWGLLMPFASFQWTHEFDASNSDTSYRLITDMDGDVLRLQQPSYQSNSMDDDYFNLGMGFSAQFNNGAAAFMNYQQLLGHDDVEDYRIKAELRFEF